jgi:hypothetical protein
MVEQFDFHKLTNGLNRGSLSHPHPMGYCHRSDARPFELVRRMNSLNIRLQFLIEAITLSLLGRLIGVLCEVGPSHLVGVFASFKAVVSTG